MKVVIANIGLKSDVIFFPILWGKIRQYCDFVDERDFSFVEWEEPIFDGNTRPEDCGKIVDRYDWKEIDFFFVSHYVWNWKTNIEIVRRIKKINPIITVVGGGPSVLYKPWQDVHLFEDYDFLAAGEAEQICADVIWNKKNNISLHDIEDLVDPSQPKDIKPKRLELKNHRPPYMTYPDDFQRFSDEIRKDGNIVGGMFETNRGCPYKCSFCDWGLTTNSKIKRYNHEEMVKELHFLTKNLKCNFVFWSDANVGIFEDDILLAKEFGYCKTNYGYPTSIYYSPAKNNRKNTDRIVKTLYDEGAISINQISFQHFDNEVLDVIDRYNIKVEELKESMKESWKRKIPLEAAFICGNPGDSLEKWKDTLEQGLQLNFQDFRIHDFMILPNAPAADPEYINKWKIDVMYREHYSDEGGRFNPENGFFEAGYTRGSFSFTNEDYIDMQIMNTLIHGLNSHNVTRFIEKWAHYYGQKPFLFFYEKLSEKPFFKEYLVNLRHSISEWVYGKSMNKFIPFEDKNVKLSFEYHLYMTCILNADKFYQEVKEVLLENYNIDEEFVDNLILYQKRTIPGHMSQKDITLEFNFKEVMGHLLRLHPSQRIPDMKVEKKIEKVKGHIDPSIDTFDKFFNERVMERVNSSGRSIQFYYTYMML